MIIEKPGAYKLSFEDYLSDPCVAPSLSRSTIISLLDCPARAFAECPRLNKQEDPEEEEDQDKFSVGVAAHSLLLEGIDNAFVVDPKDHPGAKGAIPKGWTTSEMKEARDVVRSCGKIPLLPKQYAKVCGAVYAAKRAIRECPELEIADLQKDGISEISYFWQEPNGVWCRIRPDFLRHDKRLILDVKFTDTSVNPDSYSNQIGRMGYGIQDVFYARGVGSVEKEKTQFVILAIEAKPPHFYSFHGLDMMHEDMCVQKVEWAIKKWGECLTAGSWPAYGNRVHYAEAKPWELASWEMRRYGGDEE